MVTKAKFTNLGWTIAQEETPLYVRVYTNKITSAKAALQGAKITKVQFIDPTGAGTSESITLDDG
jgi:hypothetical protein